LWVFRGSSQKKYDAELAEAWQPLGDRVQFVKCAKPGKNALDFHIAFVMGRIVGPHDRAGIKRYGAAEFVVVSKDSGFDALFEHVRSLGYRIDKAASLSEAVRNERSKRENKCASTKADAEPPASMPQPSTAAKSTKETPAPPKAELEPSDIEKIIDHLRAHPKNRPGTRKTLLKYLPTAAGKIVSAELSEAAVSALEQRGVVGYVGAKIEYKIPTKG
jgi:hypothetical protein